MNINQLETNLFVINDFHSQLSRLSKAVSYFCGLVYYRTDWLEEDITTALHKPLQKKSLKEMILLIANMGDKNLTETLWSYIKLPLIELFSPSDLICLEKSTKEMAEKLMQSISSEDFFMHITTDLSDEEEETLKEITDEINKLDRLASSNHALPTLK